MCSATPPASVFISHSSTDDEFAKWLKQQLSQAGCSVWLDDDEISVGERIAGAVNEGIKSSRFIVLLMSNASIESGWVDAEWQSRISEEIKGRAVHILPALIEDCNVPPLLVDKRYADFRSDKHKGIAELLEAISKFSLAPHASEGVSVTEIDQRSSQALDMMKRVQDSSERLSIVLPDIIAFSKSVDDHGLFELGKSILLGGKAYLDTLSPTSPAVQCRKTKAYLSYVGKLNAGYLGFKDSHAVISFLEQNGAEIEMVSPESIHDIEANAALSNSSYIPVVKVSASTFGFDGLPEYPHDSCYLYAAWDTHIDMIARMRTAIASQLMEFI
ncbi:MAG: hypothetical protein Tsb0013_05420 [Phycisphaerales bacterium]